MAIKNGFNIQLVAGIPSEYYGLEKSGKIEPAMEFRALYGLRMGYRWYIFPQDKWGMGITSNWFDLSLSYKKGTYDEGSFIRTISDISILQFGPIVTVRLSSDMAIDGYFTVRPTLMDSYRKIEYPDDSNYDSDFKALGINDAFGIAYRWKVLCIGIDYVFGSIKITGQRLAERTETKIVTNNIQFVLGVKF